MAGIFRAKEETGYLDWMSERKKSVPGWTGKYL